MPPLAAGWAGMLEFSTLRVEDITADALFVCPPAGGLQPQRPLGPVKGGDVEAHEAHEIAEQIHEHGEAEAHAEARHDVFRRLTAVYVGVVAMLLAIATLGGAAATKEMLNANIHASDTYAFYQAKYLRQQQYQIAAEQLDLLSPAAWAPDRKAAIERLSKHYRETAARYEDEPKTGKKELLAKAREWEHERDHAARQNPNFEYAEAFFQIAIVLGSVAIVAASPWLLGVSSLLSLAGLLLTINGYLLLVPLGHV